MSYLPNIRVRQRPEINLPQSVPPKLLVSGVDAVILQRHLKTRKIQKYLSKHRARLITQHPSGSLNFKTPQTSRINMERDQARIVQRKRRIKSNRAIALQLEIKTREEGSKYSGYTDASPVKLYKQQPNRYAPGMKHVRLGMKHARKAQRDFEQRLTMNHQRLARAANSTLTTATTATTTTTATTLCEQELFQISARLAQTYQHEWLHWNTTRARTLQKNARVHLDRTVLHHYSNRTQECDDYVKNNRLQLQHKWMKKVLRAWHGIAKKRFSFRAFLIRSRNVMYEIRCTRIFHRWKEYTFTRERILWRQKYYTLVLGGWKSRRRRMLRTFTRWKTIYVPIHKLSKKIHRRGLQQIVQGWYQARHQLSVQGERLQCCVVLQRWWKQMFIRLQQHHRQQMRHLEALIATERKRNMVKTQKCLQIQRWWRARLQRNIEDRWSVLVRGLNRKRGKEHGWGIAMQHLAKEKKKRVFVLKKSRHIVHQFVLRQSMVQNPFDSLLMNQYLEDRYAEDESDVRRLLDEAEQWMVVNE